MKKALKIIAILISFFFIGTIAFFAYIYFIVFDYPFDNKEFDKVTWEKFSENMEPDNPRGEMFENLTEQHLKTGMTKSEVIKLLGKPDFREEKDFLSYNIGMWSGYRIDYDSLDLKFNEKGELIEFYRVQH